MDRRSWPWKKKSSDKSDKAAAESEVAASPSEQETNKKPSYIQISFEQYSLFTGLNGRVKKYEEQVRSLEDRINDLNDKLFAANAEITTKDGLVKQHTKVAEEAVSGWEKAEAEALTLKTHLETVTLSKLTAEDRAAHLDVALKDCTRQIRSLKEEHEHKLQDVVLTKAKQMDKFKVESEAKIADFEQELVRCAAENNALSSSLQERSNMLIRISEEKSQAEAEIEHLKNNIESCEREINSLKYELHVVSKELEIRNEEKNMSMRSAEAANKQHMDGVKKIAKLEAECQRLRGLVRKKLPGAAALAQMKLEVESLGRDDGDSRLKRSPFKPSSPRMSPMVHRSPVHDFSLDGTQKFQKENELLTERLLAMEEETKMLEEALAKRNSELHISRNLCAKTANRLQSLESELQQKNPTRPSAQIPSEVYASLNSSNPPSLVSMSEDGNDDTRSCAESWSTTVISDISRSRRDKNVTKLRKAESANHLELMDDFLEMEKLAYSSNDSSLSRSNDKKKKLEVICSCERQCDSETTLTKVSSESALSMENLESDVEVPPVIRLRSRIYEVLQTVSKEADIEKVLEEIRKVTQDIRSASNVSENVAYCNDMERETVHVISQELIDAVSQVHSFVLFLAKEARAVHDPSSEANTFSQTVEEFSSTFDKVLRREKTLIDFIFDLSHVLSEASELKISVFEFDTSEVKIHCLDCIDKVALPENKVIQNSSSNQNYQNGCAHFASSKSYPGLPEDGNLAYRSESNAKKCKIMPDEYRELKKEEGRVESDLDMIKSQLHETQQLLAATKLQLDSAQRSNGLAETQLKCMAESYRLLETRSIELETEANLLREKIESLENELQDEKTGRNNAITRCKEIEEQLQRTESCLVCSAAEADLKSKQNKEVAAAAEKLAECQETIFQLGKQLKALRPQTEHIGSPYLEPTQKPEDEPLTTSNTDTQDLDRTDTHTAISPDHQRLGAESPNIYNPPNCPSDNETPNVSMRSLKHPKHKHIKLSPSSSSGPIPEKPSRGFSRFFSSKAK